MNKKHYGFKGKGPLNNHIPTEKKGGENEFLII